jgi:hypothetical protein
MTSTCCDPMNGPSVLILQLPARYRAKTRNDTVTSSRKGCGTLRATCLCNVLSVCNNRAHTVCLAFMNADRIVCCLLPVLSNLEVFFFLVECWFSCKTTSSKVTDLEREVGAERPLHTVFVNCISMQASSTQQREGRAAHRVDRLQRT